MAGAAVLAGRTEELRAVTALLSGETERAAMLLSGEAGVGKSRLASEATALAVSSGIVVLSGWCLQLSQGLPFLPFVDALRAMAALDEGRVCKTALAECPPFVSAELARLVPDLSVPGEDAPGVAVNSEWDKHRLFEAIRRILATLAELRRFALLIEDVHWADVSTLEVLEYLLTPGRTTGVPILLTCRMEEWSGHVLSDWVERMHRNPGVERLRLAPMTKEETAQQVTLLIGARPTNRVVEQIYRRSEGNAFFTEQLVAARSVDEGDGSLPVELSSLLLSRTRQLSGPVRSVLAALAVSGRPLDEASIATLCQLSATAVQDALRDLRGRRLLRRPDSAGRHQPRHALLAEALSADLLPGERAELHARAAELLAGWNDLGVAAEIAAHWAAAGRRREELRWRVVAGRHADAVFASAEAAAQWQRAIALTTDYPTDSVVQGMSLTDIYGAAEDALALAGEDDSAEALAREALRRFTDVDVAARADVLRRAGNAGNIASSNRALEMLYQALALYEQLPIDVGRIKTMKEIAGILHNDGRPDEAREIIDQAAELAERAGMNQALFELRCVQAMYRGRSGSPELALREIHALRVQLSERDGPAPYVWLAIFHAGVLYSLGRLDEIPAATVPALRMAAEYGVEQSFKVGMVRSNATEALFEIGAIDSAAGLIEPFSQDRPTMSTWLAYADRAHLEALRGNLDESRRRWIQLEKLPAALTFQAGNVVWIAELHLWRDDPVSALQCAEPVLGQLAAAGQSDTDGALLVVCLRACADLADRARSCRDSAALAQAVSAAERIAKVHRHIEKDPFSRGMFRFTAEADHASWQAEWARLRGNANPEQWDAAAVAWEVLRRPHRAAYARWRQAEALLAVPGGRPAAAPILRRAAEQATQHVPLMAAIADLARRARIDLIPDAGPDTAYPAPPATPTTLGLTERELAVLRLVADGKSNAEIGAELFISAKTASVHVTHILRKLDVATRVQAAAVAARAGLLTDVARSTEAQPQPR